MKYICELCGLIYNEEQGDPQHGIPAGTAFAEVSEHFECPDCGSKKEAFYPVTAKAATTKTNGDQEFWNETKYSDHKDSDK